MEYYLAMKSNEVLKHATMYINLNNIILSERSQMQRSHKVTFCMIPLTWNIQNR